MVDDERVRSPLWSRDEVILALDTYLKHDVARFHQDDPAVLELSRALNALGERLHRNVGSDFRNPNGVCMKMGNFMHLDPNYHGIGLSSVSTMEREVWNEYADHASELHLLAESIRMTIADQSDDLLDTDAEEDERDFPEGILKYRQHVTRERNRGLISRAKERARQRNGRLFCEACGFDFEAIYGAVGLDYIECHHTVPVCELMPGSNTRLDDLALLCANCHRMIHRRRPWLCMEQLRFLLKEKADS